MINIQEEYQRLKKKILAKRKALTLLNKQYKLKIFKRKKIFRRIVNEMIIGWISQKQMKDREQNNEFEIKGMEQWEMMIEEQQEIKKEGEQVSQLQMIEEKEEIKKQGKGQRQAEEQLQKDIDRMKRND